MSREAALNESLEWLLMIDEGQRRNEAARVLNLSTAVGALFSESSWAKVSTVLSKQTE